MHIPTILSNRDHTLYSSSLCLDICSIPPLFWTLDLYQAFPAD